jgi:hypothetical protein
MSTAMSGVSAHQRLVGGVARLVVRSTLLCEYNVSSCMQVVLSATLVVSCACWASEMSMSSEVTPDISLDRSCASGGTSNFRVL